MFEYLKNRRTLPNKTLFNTQLETIILTEENPYKAPRSNVINDQDTILPARLEQMAAGQKLVVYAVLVYFIAVFARLVLGPIALLLIVASLLMSLVGLYKVLTARESHIAVKIILFILLFVPLVNILVLLRINGRATKTLREAGYKVGLMGATKS